jgi:hypothetical protein
LKSAWAAAAPTSITITSATTMPVERRTNLNGLCIPRTPVAPWFSC